MNKLESSFSFKNIFKREIKLASYIIACSTIIVISLSYAIFLQVNKNSNDQVVSSGDLSFTYQDNNGNEITSSTGSITSTAHSECFEPMTKEEALSMASTCAYKFSVTNSGTLEAAYKISLGANDDNQLTSNLYVILKKQNENGILEEVGQERLVSSLTNGELTSVEGFSPNSIDVYSVQLYVGSNCPDSDIGKKISYKIIGSGLVYEITPTEPSTPELATGMIPIKYDGTTMKVADTSSGWYSYVNHEWANAVLVDVSKSTIKDKYFNNDMTLKTTAVGQTVDMSEIQQMYVWIPRYRYQLWNVNNGSSDPQAINIVFEDKDTPKSTGSHNSEWLTHPAFTFGSDELNGIWVGKFENSGSTSNITVKPNMASLARLNVSTMFNASRAVESSSLLGLDANQIDSHMMKDTEWGAVAYLYSSIYGTYNLDNTCISRGCEVWINNVSSDGTWTGTKYTGCAAQGVSTGAVTGTACESGRGWDGAGVNASTTGNMYGIYDMSGGNWEYTMSVMLQNDGTPQIQNSGFSSMPESKYYNTYPYGTSYSDHARGTIGTATKETLKTFGSNPGGWNGDYSDLVNSFYAWAKCGGGADNTTGAGVFAFTNRTGEADAYFGFRLVLALTA